MRSQLLARQVLNIVVISECPLLTPKTAIQRCQSELAILRGEHVRGVTGPG